MKRFVVPAILLVILIYPIGIRSYLFTRAYTSCDVDAPGPAMQLNDISKGFSRSDAARPFPIFHSMVTGVFYVPYIWARTSILPPYDLKTLDARYPDLKKKLIVLLRSTNILAAIGITLLAFYIILMLYKNPLPAFLVSLAVALNPDLMFQSSITYYENWSVFWVMLSVFCFVKLALKRKNVFLWLAAFFITGALAVATHERMLGYYIFAAPFLIYKFYMDEMNGIARVRKILIISAALTFGVIVFCLANNVFSYGFAPVLDYLRFKSMGIKSTSDRMGSVSAFIFNQVRCHAHTAWLVFWNTGGILSIFALYGAFIAWKKRLYPSLALLLFPLGYQVLSIGLPGWTSGRYILGQAIFTVLFAAIGIGYFIARAENKNKSRAAIILFALGLLLELFILSMVKIADTYYHPCRVIESVINDPASQGKKITIQGFIDPQGDAYCPKGVKCELLPEGQAACNGADIIISSGKTGCGCSNLRKEIVRSPPAWLVFLIKRQCYLYSHGCSSVRIQWCDND